MSLDALLECKDNKDLLDAMDQSVQTVSLMPEYLVVCCWRSIKEVSLLLGQLCQEAPIRDPEADLAEGLISVTQVNGRLAVYSLFSCQPPASGFSDAMPGCQMPPWCF